MNIIIIGLGAMGSAAAQQLAERGHRVQGLDRFHPPHSYGSSHGETRITRQSYWEDWRYVPLLLRAYELWRRLEVDSGAALLQQTGGLMIGPAGGDLVERSRESAERYDLPHRMLSRRQMEQFYPLFALRDDMVALWEHNAGYLLPEACVGQQLTRAAAAGAELHFDEPVLEWEGLGEGGVRVRTAAGLYEADRLVITAGPWAPEILQPLGLPLEVTRQVLWWFAPQEKNELFDAGRLPVFLFDCEPGAPILYGFPRVPGHDGTVKVALHGSHVVCTPETVERAIGVEEEVAMRTRVAGAMPLLNGKVIRAQTCLYTMLPDEHFVIDHHPELPQVVVAAGFSGHGFKFASVVGEILANLATDVPTELDLELFAIRRFGNRRPTLDVSLRHPAV